MASSSARSLSNNPNRRSQRSSGNRSSDRTKQPKKQESGFFDGLKNIVAGPLSWFGAIGKEQADSDEENHPGDSFVTGSKRPVGTSQKERGGSPAHKRVRRESPTSLNGALGQSNPGGYLDLPFVLRDSTGAPNIPQLQRQAVPPSRFRIESNGNSFSDGLQEERRPHRPAASSALGPAIDRFTRDEQLDSHSPLRQAPSKAGLATVASPNSGVRRTTSLAFSARGDLTSAGQQRNRHQSDAIRFNPLALNPLQRTETEPEEDHLMKSPLGDRFSRVSRSPSVTDGGVRAQASPDRDRTQGPLRMGSVLRTGYAMKSVSPSKRSSGVVFPSGGLMRRGSSMMTVDSVGAPLERKSSSQMIFEPTMGITTPEEVAATAEPTIQKPKAPRNNAERILMALEHSIPLSDARKFRLKQKEGVRVPASSSLDPQTSRMLMPYSRPSASKGKTGEDAESGALSKPGALRRYLDAERKAKKARLSLESQKKELSVIAESSKEDMAVETDAPKTPEGKKVEKAVEATPEEEPTAEIVRPTPMPGRATSSLRAVRAPAFRTHMPSSRSSNRFSAKFLDDEDEDVMQEDTAALTPAELSKWTQRGGGSLEVPAGFSFDFAKPKAEDNKKEEEAKAAAAAAQKAKEEEEKAKREQIIRQLRGDQPPVSQPLTFSGPAKLPSVPTKPIAFAGKAADKFTIPSYAAPPKTPEPEPKKAEPRYPPSLSVQPPTPVTAAPAPAQKPFSFALPSTSAAQKPQAPTAPAPTTAPVLALPFSFGGPAATSDPGPAPSPFSLAPTSQAKPAFSFGLPNGTTEKPATPSADPAPKPLFAFGSASSSTATTPAEPAKASVPPSNPAADGRSTAPSPSPFVFSKPAETSTSTKPAEAKPAVSFAFADPKASATPAEAPKEAPKPIFSFGASTPASTTATATPAPVFSFGAKPTESKPNLFGAASSATTPAASAQGGFPFKAPETPAKADGPAPSLFSFGAPAPGAAKPAATPSPFSFSGTSAPVAAPTPFSFGAPTPTPATNLFAASTPSKAKTPPPRQDSSDMMDEGSPTQPAPVSTSNGFGNSTLPASAFSPVVAPSVINPPSTATTPAATAPTFGFTFGAGPSSNNPFASNNTLNPTSAGPFSGTAPSSPFPSSQPASPFQSPLQQAQGIHSPANVALSFGSPQQAPGVFGNGAGGAGFSFGAGSAANSPVQGNITPTTPTFVFGSGKPSNDRPIKPPPRRAASTARRGGAAPPRR